MSEPMREVVGVSFEAFKELLDKATALDAANREKDAEIERLTTQCEIDRSFAKFCQKKAADSQTLLRETESQLASLRASGGEKWIDVKQELPPEGVPVWVLYGGVVQHMTYSRVDGEWCPASDEFDNVPDGTFSHWMTYKIPAQPTLTREKE